MVAVEKKEKKTNNKLNDKKNKDKKLKNSNKSSKTELQAHKTDVSSNEEEISEMKIHPTKATNTNKVVVEPTPYWYKVTLPEVSIKNVQRLSPTDAAEKLTYAKQLLTEENGRAESHPLLTSSNRSFMSNIITSGTLNDKVSALTLMFRESPLHGMKTLDTLMNMGRKKGRNEAVMAITSLKDLFISSVLPDRKLIYFVDRPLASKDVTDLHLLLWAFEDHLKKTYLEFLRIIEELCHDTLMYVRNNMVTCLFDLLANKPEQEQNLLKLLVNKLGDSDNKVASKTSQLLVDLLVKHPGMKLFVIREVEQLLFHPSTSEKAQYYSLITMNQTILTSRETVTANKLIEIYFVFFRKLLKLVEEDEKELLKNKKKTEEEPQPEKKSEKRIAKEKQQKKKELEIEDHQAKMIAAILTGVNRAFHFANISDEMVEKHLEVLYKMTHVATFNAAIQALSLIFTISLSKQNTSDRFYRTLYESLLDPRLSHSSKQSMYLNLLYKAVRADTDTRRVKAFIKRMVQIAHRNQPHFITGIFFLLSQLMDAQPGLRTMLAFPEGEEEDDDEEEYFVDAPEEEDDEEKKKKIAEEKAKRAANKQEYDGRKRDPRFANAEKTYLWELIPFKKHYHPSVCKYTEQLFAGEKIQNQEDLHQFTLMHFLDKFVYRNAKKQATTKGQSIMQPLPGSRRDGGVIFTKGSGIVGEDTPLNSEKFLEKKEEDVDADELFFYKYFNQKAAEAPKKPKKAAADSEDAEEDEIWRAMMNSVPGGLEDEDEDDADLDDDEDDEEMRALLMEDEDDEDVDEAENLSEGLIESDEEDMDGEDDVELEFMNASDMDEAEEEQTSKRALDSDEDEEGEEAPSKPKKKKAKKDKLPTFASYEDYAKLIEQDLANDED
ncbi:CBF/Mak21 family-domain-containing protein [Mycotypha africana]|uniref:CBF/Mak21 family-domain-containing protein n=1 Tax=Mycotypha africana TaxID=64632 RepID=UPI0023007C7C|nr:CBF/Mak21 family-domain-containing protein [Mycotypha africana]KAI8991981.1 CBF/Mak21 family-domain-containing protein [Mycotypha africana]